MLGGASTDPVTTFIQEFKLDRSSEEALRQLSMELQRQVIAKPLEGEDSTAALRERIREVDPSAKTGGGSLALADGEVGKGGPGQTPAVSKSATAAARAADAGGTGAVPKAKVAAAKEAAAAAKAASASVEGGAAAEAARAAGKQQVSAAGGAGEAAPPPAAAGPPTVEGVTSAAPAPASLAAEPPPEPVGSGWSEPVGCGWGDPVPKVQQGGGVISDAALGPPSAEKTSAEVTPRPCSAGAATPLLVAAAAVPAPVAVPPPLVTAAAPPMLAPAATAPTPQLVPPPQRIPVMIPPRMLPPPGLPPMPAR